MINIDVNAKNAFKKYVENMVEELKSDGLPVVLCGDTLEQQFIPWFEKHGVKIDNWYDRDEKKRGTKKDLGYTVKGMISPEDIEDIYEPQGYNAVVVVPYFTQIRDKLFSLKTVPNRIYYVDFAKFHDHPTLYKNRGKRICKNRINEINEVYDLLYDDKSRMVLEKLLNYWISGDINYVMEFREQQRNQYLDTVSFDESEVFVNVGACDGRYTDLFIEKVNNRFERIYNIECDPVNMSIMKQKYNEDARIEFIERGISNKKETMRFYSEGNSASYIDKENGNIEIQLDTIDHIFANKKVTFIKADIEGYELKLLKGAKKTIKEQKPKLAICAYHQVDHLVEIPLLIKRLNPEYHIAIRHYTDTLSETVCYAW